MSSRSPKRLQRGGATPHGASSPVVTVVASLEPRPKPFQPLTLNSPPVRVSRALLKEGECVAEGFSGSLCADRTHVQALVAGSRSSPRCDVSPLRFPNSRFLFSSTSSFQSAQRQY
ncbi:hypothetical protein EYF80_022612 [Liparis tanakae]|uniref:Uncharacterized protein n=1 Tax=Liparis tanakae TaxID=230148 RepID=A0A4Z2HPL0_9TELE|nr:hypothetical protein EYF80_022612 [Liparis tanakae]